MLATRGGDSQKYASKGEPLRLSFPTATHLALPKLGSQLAARVGLEELARVEPVLGCLSHQHRGDRPRELCILGATQTPQAKPTGYFRKTRDLFDAAVAVRRNDQDVTGKARAGGNSKHHVVMKLALLPVVDKFVAAELRSQQIQARPKDEAIRQAT